MKRRSFLATAEGISLANELARLSDPRVIAHLKRVAATATDEQIKDIVDAIKDKDHQKRVRQIMNAAKKPVA